MILKVFPNILQVKRVVVYLGRDKTMQLLEELMYELELTDPVSSAVTHMDNPPYYRITSSYKIPSVTSGTVYMYNLTTSFLNMTFTQNRIKEHFFFFFCTRFQKSVW